MPVYDTYFVYETQDNNSTAFTVFHDALRDNVSRYTIKIYMFIDTTVKHCTESAEFG